MGVAGIWVAFQAISLAEIGKRMSESREGEPELGCSLFVPWKNKIWAALGTLGASSVIFKNRFPFFFFFLSKELQPYSQGKIKVGCSWYQNHTNTAGSLQSFPWEAVPRYVHGKCLLY